jgi:hypothetical protein
MKKIIFIFFLIGCQSKDPEPKISLAGTWNGMSDSVTNCSFAPNNTPESPCKYCSYYTMTETMATFSYMGGSITGPYTIKGDSVLMPFLKGYGLDKRKFRLQGVKLTLSYSTSGCINNNIYSK